MAVKVIDPRGNEGLRVLTMAERYRRIMHCSTDSHSAGRESDSLLALQGAGSALAVRHEDRHSHEDTGTTTGELLV